MSNPCAKLQSPTGVAKPASLVFLQLEILNFILQQPAANKLTKGLGITDETALTPRVST